MKKVFKKLSLVFVLSLLGSLYLSNGNNSTKLVKAAEGDEALYQVSYSYWMKDRPQLEQNGYLTFNNADDFRSWCDETIKNKTYANTFSSIKIKLVGDADVFFIYSYTYQVDFNNHNFNLVDDKGSQMTALNLGGTYSREVTFKNAKFPGSLEWNLRSGVALYLDNIVIDGENKTYTKDIINLDDGCSIHGDGVKIQNFNLKGDTEILDICGTDVDSPYYAAIGDFSGEPFQFINIHSPDRNGVISLEKGAELFRVQFISCSSKNGGAINLVNGNIDECVFENCSSTEDGGAIYATGGGIEDCVFKNNKTNDGDGGAIYVESKGFTIYNSSFTENYSSDDGGAIYFDNDECHVTKCTFDKNKSKNDGGAVYFNGELSDCFTSTFTNNSSGGDGGAICIDGDDCEIKSCTFTSNHSDDDDGAIYVCVGIDDAQINNCKFEKNNATGDNDDIDGRSDTMINGSRYGSILSEGNIVLVIVILAGSLIIGGSIIFVSLRKRKDKETSK